ncbi:PREDICTED: signaling lymphocytic activation molecule [Chrysochloris asiatica]|uniref:Signaling lymphocytic activation molecule n=1 Tax=Chrysochloris asiatica TaxID=185453 RepID=A0A9B0TJD9_CHRAS|nr:PREDICTED: signaling lymphocytic activation molecule [Chrysochloris asiatica]
MVMKVETTHPPPPRRRWTPCIVPVQAIPDLLVLEKSPSSFPPGLLQGAIINLWSLCQVVAIMSISSHEDGGQSADCPKIIQRLGSNVMLPLAYEGINKSMSKSIRIVVTMETSLGSVTKKKIMSFNPTEVGSPPNLELHYKFHLENLSLEILESRKEDEGWYSMTLEQNFSVQQFCLQLRLYEEVSVPEIKVLNLTQDSGNCSLILACMVEKGDHVIYSWSQETDIHPLSLVNSSHLLYLTISPQDVNNVYVCTVSNPISNHSQTFNSWRVCSPNHPESKPWELYVWLFLGIIIGVILLKMIIQLLRRRGKADNVQSTADHVQTTVEAKSLTIYAQVQNSGPIQKKPDAPPAQDPCTTIYVAATEPVPEPVQEPNSITVYASMTLPES